MQDQSTLAPRLTRRVSLGLAAGGLFAAAAQAAEARPEVAAPGFAAPGFSAVDAVAAKLIDDHRVPGLSISLMRAGQLIYSKGFGWANLETKTPVAPKTIFKIASNTKQFTAAAVMLLQEEGKLSVDDKLARFYPDFPRGSEVSLRQMLTHTSGLGNYTRTTPRLKFFQDARRDYDADALYTLMKGTDPLYLSEPGANWEYVNTGYVLLGLIVQKVAGEPYGAYLKRRIFDPAGMRDTALDNMAELVPNRASGYSAHPGSSVDFDNASYVSMTYVGGAGALRSTTDDLCRWRAALFGGRIVSAASLKEMITPARLKDGSQPMSGSGPGPKKPINYGFGLIISTMEGRPCIRHTGHVNGFQSELRTFPNEQLTYAFLSNIDNFDSRRPSQDEIDALTAAAMKAGLGNA